jgi:hypothetical protein
MFPDMKFPQTFPDSEFPDTAWNGEDLLSDSSQHETENFRSSVNGVWVRLMMSIQEQK